MNRYIILVSLLIFYSMTGCSSESNNSLSNASSATQLSWLRTEGNKIVNKDGEKQILRGVNRSGLEYDKKGNGISKDEIVFITKEWKARIIRLPFNQDWITNDKAYENFMDNVISWIAEQDAYAMLDLQWQDTNVKIPPIPNKEAVEMWRKIAQKYKNNPAVLYDIHNEAHDTSWEAWRARASEIIEAIQSIHPNALIFVSGLDWAYDIRGWGENPLPYKNIVYSTHPYPFKGEPWAWDKFFGAYADSLPVYAGEFGGEAKDLDWGRRLLAYFNEKEMGWTAWSWVDSPHITQQDRRTPTEFGQLIKEALLKHASPDSTL